MDIKNLVEQLPRDKADETLTNLLTGLLSPAFGALPKSEIEMLTLDALIKVGAVNGPDLALYDLVSRLRVTRTKARRLIYDHSLRTRSMDDRDKALKRLLERPLILKSGHLFGLEIEDPLLADHLRDRLRRLGHATDGSFSSSLVTMPLDAYSSLIDSYLDHGAGDELRSALIKAGAPDTTLSGIIKATLLRLGSKVANETGEALVDDAFGILSDIFQGKVNPGFGALFMRSHSDATKL